MACQLGVAGRSVSRSMPWLSISKTSMCVGVLSRLFYIKLRGYLAAASRLNPVFTRPPSATLESKTARSVHHCPPNGLVAVGVPVAAIRTRPCEFDAKRP
jgi:hypothetical protein